MKRKKITKSKAASKVKRPRVPSAVTPKQLPTDGSLTMSECLAELAALGHKLCAYSVRKRVADGSLLANKTPYRLLFSRCDIAAFVARARKK